MPTGPDNAEHREAIVPKWNESPLFHFFTRHYPGVIPVPKPQL
jgi:hypothetical protein